MLKERTIEQNISHKKMPTWQHHCHFVKNNPYYYWFIIKNGNENIGNVYLTLQNEIGIFLLKKHIGKGFGKKVLNLLIEKNNCSFYLANISPKNKQSIAFFKKEGFKLIQYTYKKVIKPTEMPLQCHSDL